MSEERFCTEKIEDQLQLEMEKKTYEIASGLQHHGVVEV
jgi:hypothetical protein